MSLNSMTKDRNEIKRLSEKANADLTSEKKKREALERSVEELRTEKTGLQEKLEIANRESREKEDEIRRINSELQKANEVLVATREKHEKTLRGLQEAATAKEIEVAREKLAEEERQAQEQAEEAEKARQTKIREEELLKKEEKEAEEQKKRALEADRRLKEEEEQREKEFQDVKLQKAKVEQLEKEKPRVPTLVPGEIATVSPFRTTRSNDLANAISEIGKLIESKDIPSIGPTFKSLGDVQLARDRINAVKTKYLEESKPPKQDRVRVFDDLENLLIATYEFDTPQFADAQTWPSGRIDKRPRFISEIVRNVFLSAPKFFEEFNVGNVRHKGPLIQDDMPLQSTPEKGETYVRAFGEIIEGKAFIGQLDTVIAKLKTVKANINEYRANANLIIYMRNLVAAMVGIATGKKGFAVHITSELQNDDMLEAPLGSQKSVIGDAPRTMQMKDDEDIFDWNTTM